MQSLDAARVLRLLTWPAALFIAGILLWYEQYKLTGHPRQHLPVHRADGMAGLPRP